jgi:hypothetical protein
MVLELLQHLFAFGHRREFTLISGAHHLRQHHAQPLDRFNVRLLRGQPGVVRALHPQPHRSRRAERPLKACCDVRRHATRLAKNGVNRVAGHAEVVGKRANADATLLERRNEEIAQHLSGVAGLPHWAAGVKVRQGEIIGYVGSTGLASGPHLHYEVLINSRFVDPLAIQVPRERSLTGRQRVESQKERARIDDLRHLSPVLTASK